MSDQTPLTPPSPPVQGFEPYLAPAYGDVAPDAPTLHAPAPPLAAPTAPPGPAGPAAPLAAPTAGLAPYPISPAAYPGGPAPYGIAPQYAATSAPAHPLAITSLVLGIVGIVGLILTPVLFFTFVLIGCSPFAIWLGLKSRREIRTQPHRYSGEGLATGGFVTGIIGLVLGVLALLALVAIVIFFVSLFSATA